MDGLRNVHTTLPGQRPNPRGDIDAVAEDVAFFENDVAEIDTDPHRDALFVRQSLVHLRNRVAQCGRTTRGLDAALKLDEHQLGRFFEDISAELDDLRLDDFGQECPEAGKTVGFIAGQQPVVRGYEDGRVSATGARTHIL